MNMDGWRHIKIGRLVWFCHEAPTRLRWRVELDGNRLVLVLPRGRVLDFKINGGCWVKKR